MSGRRLVQAAQGAVKPILSLNSIEAHRRVLNLYRAWFRQIPYILKQMSLPIDETTAKHKLREMFLRNSNVRDIRVIDMLVIKGQMELKEAALMHAQECHIMAYFKETETPRPRDFVSRFLANKDSE